MNNTTFVYIAIALAGGMLLGFAIDTLNIQHALIVQANDDKGTSADQSLTYLPVGSRRR